MATRPSTLDCTAFPFPVGRNVGDQCCEGRPVTRTWSLPAVSCRRRRRRNYRRLVCLRSGSPYTDFYRDHEPTAGDSRPEVEFSTEVGRSWSMTDVVELSSSAVSRSVRPGSVTAATSFQTCINEDEEELALTTSSADSDTPVTVLEEPPSGRHRATPLTSLLSPGLRPPRRDSHRLCPPPSGSRGRRSASMGAVRPSTIFRPRFDNCNADFGEL